MTDIFAVLEADPSGHRLHYVRHLVEAAGPGRCVVFISGTAAHSEEYRTHADAIRASTQILGPADTPRALLKAAVSRARALGARTLILPDGDQYLLPLLPLLMREPWLRLEVRLLLMRTTTVGGPERLRLATLVKPVLVRLVRVFPRVRVLFLTDALGVVTRRRGFPGIPAVHDPVPPPREPCRERPTWLPRTEPGTTTVGVFGVVSPRKNLPLLVAATAWLPDVTLVVGGRLEPEVSAFLETNRAALELAATRRLVVVDRLLGAEEFAAALAGVDVVAVLHDNDAPSGILAEACVRHTPVLVPSGGWLAQVAGSTGVGVATPMTVSGVTEGIRELVQNHGMYVAATYQQAPRISVSNFADRLLG